MNTHEAIISQYLSALAMLKQTIAKCPEAIWNSPDDKTKFWQIAYHALFYTHLYLQDSAQAFTTWSKHRKDYESIRPANEPQIGAPYGKEDLFEFLAFCQQQAAEKISQVDLDAPSGFDWLPFGKLELQFYNIRHLQQHTGELMERLGSRAGVEIDWVSRVHK